MNTDTYGTVLKNGPATCLARIVGEGGLPVSRTDVASGQYSVFLLDRHDPDARLSVAGHEDVEVNVATAVFDSLQTDARWSVDDEGYNFLHTINVSVHPTFTLAGREYLVEYRLVPYAGQIILARFRLHCI